MITKNFTKIMNKYCEDEMILLDNDTGKVLLQGDYYHNKIDIYIDGYIHGLEAAGYKVNVSFIEEGTHPDFEVQEGDY